MSNGRLRVARIWLSAACLAIGAITNAAGEPVCAPDRGRPGEVVDVMAGFAPTFRSDSEVPTAGVFRLTLRPSTEVRFLVGSTRAFGDDDGYGGVVTFPVLTAGRYYIQLSEPAAIELVQNYRQLPLRPRSGNMRSGEVDIDDGAVVLQVRAATTTEIVISISTPPPCRRDG
jgi:hypothetical protein